MFKSRKNRFFALSAGVVLFAALTPSMLSAAPEVAAISTDSTNVSASTIEEDNSEFARCLITHMEKKFYRNINATQDQQGQISKIIDDTMDANRSTRLELKRKTAALIDAIGNNETESQLRTKISEIRALREKLADSRVDSLMKAMTVLKPEQKKTMTEKLKQRLSDRFGLRWWKES